MKPFLFPNLHDFLFVSGCVLGGTMKRTTTPVLEGCVDSYYLDSRVKVSNAGEFYTCNMQGRSEVYIQEDGEFTDHLKDSEMTRVISLSFRLSSNSPSTWM